jgi:hypothetical protein
MSRPDRKACPVTLETLVNSSVHHTGKGADVHYHRNSR